MSVFLDALTRPPEAAIGGLRPSAAARVLVRTRATGWLVVPTRDEADEWVRTLRFFASCEPSRGATDPPPPRVLLYPADDGRPWDGISPDPELGRMRISARAARTALVVAPAKALLLRVPAVDSLVLKREMAFRPGELVTWLTARGYLVVQQVDQPGTVAVRGGVVDVWPAGSDLPARIERFDDEIEAIRTWDPDGKVKGREQKALTLLPVREAVLTSATAERAAAWTQAVMHERADEAPGLVKTWRRVVGQLRDGAWFSGAEDYVPALVDVDAVKPRRPLYAWEPERVRAELSAAAEQVKARWAAIPPDDRPLVRPEDRYLSASQVDLAGLVALTELASPDAPTFAVAPKIQAGGDLAPVVKRLRGWVREGRAVTLVAQEPRVERVVAMLHNAGLEVPRIQHPADPGSIGIIAGPLAEGFVAEDQVWITANDIFGARLGGEPEAAARPRGRSFREAQRKSFALVQPGQFLVHVRHGIGRFVGISRTPAGIEHGDFVTIEYKDGARLHVPIHRLDLVTPYQGADATAPKLDRLGGATWEARKAKVADAIAGLASDLLLIQARRALAKAPAFEGRDELYLAFEEGFPFVETPDQEAAIHDVLDDLAAGKPMDRIVIGDVGFGKTEVAMRAAFRVAQDGWQVALLCPTSVLAMQHGETFKRRFDAASGGTLRVETLSRLTSAADERRILKDLVEGRVDVLIGTTRLLSSDIRYKRLGLLVVDEEHRFGTRQKEELKRIASGVHTLTLTATPIPRTLQMALTGLRELSVLSTPPMGRQRIRTEVVRFDPERIREDILHELKRDGQVFFVHNRVQSMAGVEKWLRKLVPEAKIGVAHGQMAPAELERRLRRFIVGEDNVLLSTAIIESGIDLPLVNTMIINRGEMFGLAQLYQLRGRVGRGNVRAHCTVLTSGEHDARSAVYERLQAFQKHNELGSNFALASEDLEQRGAGDILGDRQHGQISSIGFDAYLELLEEAVAKARGQGSVHRIDPDVDIGVTALLPDSWIPELPDRLQGYQDLALARTQKEAERAFAVLVERNGKAPAEATTLLRVTNLRIRCRELGIERLSMLKVRALIRVVKGAPGPAWEKAAQLGKENPRRWKWEEGELEVRFAPEEAVDVWRFVNWVLGSLGG